MTLRKEEKQEQCVRLKGWAELLFVVLLMDFLYEMHLLSSYFSQLQNIMYFIYNI